MATRDVVKNRRILYIYFIILDFVSVADLLNYWVYSNETLQTYRAETLAVHLVIGFDGQRKMAMRDVVKNRQILRIYFIIQAFLSVADLQSYWVYSNKTLHTYRGVTLVVHLGIGSEKWRFGILSKSSNVTQISIPRVPHVIIRKCYPNSCLMYVCPSVLYLVIRHFLHYLLLKMILLQF